MVAITVILAAVIGTFVLQIGNQTGDTAPSVSASISDADNNFDDTAAGENAYKISIQSVDRRVEMSNIRIAVRDPDTGEVQGVEMDADNDFGNGNLDLIKNGTGTAAIGGEDALGTGDVLVIQQNAGSTLEDNTEYEVVIFYLGGDEPQQLATSVVQVR